MNKNEEYKRLSAEILQDQRIRINIFTFSITASAAIMGFSSQFASADKADSPLSLLAIVSAIYAIIIPCIILVYHYTRGINCKSEYLRIAHEEQWMVAFDKLTEKIIPGDDDLKKTYRIVSILGGYTTEKSFTIAYLLLNFIICSSAVTKAHKTGYLYLTASICFFLGTFAVMIVFRPMKKKEYRRLWINHLQNKH